MFPLQFILLPTPLMRLIAVDKKENTNEKISIWFRNNVSWCGVMFVLMHGEVSADSKPDPFVCSESPTYGLWHCETKTLDCAYSNPGMSCVKKGMFK